MHSSEFCHYVSHFRLLGNRWTDFDETWQEASTRRHLPSLFLVGSVNKDGGPGIWLAFTLSASPQSLSRFRQNFPGSYYSTSIIIFVFWGISVNKDGRTGFWLADTCPNSPLQPLNWFWYETNTQRHLLTKFVFFGPICRQRWPSWPLIHYFLTHFCLILCTLYWIHDGKWVVLF